VNPLAWLVSFVMPACGLVGTAGLPPPAPMDLAHIERPATPNTALAAPAGFRPAPDIETPIYPVDPDRLLQTARRVAAEQPRTYLAADFPALRQVHYVARSALFNFPDLITVQVAPAAPDAAANPAGHPAATLVLWSRSVYGRSDLGVNRKRLAAWLAALDAELQSPAERQ
jgi:uncharacterized protein (DUF1499 family)